jgi:hypothetical protein
VDAHRGTWRENAQGNGWHRQRAGQQGNGQVGTRLHDLVQSRALGKHSRQQQHFFIALFLFFSVPALHCYIILFYQHIYYNLINISPLHCSKLHFYWIQLSTVFTPSNWYFQRETCSQNDFPKFSFNFACCRMLQVMKKILASPIAINLRINLSYDIILKQLELMLLMGLSPNYLFCSWRCIELKGYSNFFCHMLSFLSVNFLLSLNHSILCVGCRFNNL